MVTISIPKAAYVFSVGAVFRLPKMTRLLKLSISVIFIFSSDLAKSGPSTNISIPSFGDQVNNMKCHFLGSRNVEV